MVNINRITLIAIVLIIVFGFAVYGNSLKGQFILDDNTLVGNNTYIRNWSNIPKLFTQDVSAGSGLQFGFYRPIMLLTYMVDYSIWKLDKRGYHLTNIIFQILAALSIYWFITVLFGDRLLSLLTAAFFIVHPIHVETVTYISGRDTPLALLFMMLCFIFYIKNSNTKSTGTFILMLAAYALSLLTKEGSLIFPGLLLLYHYAFKKRIEVKAFVPILCVAIIYMAMRTIILKSPPFDISLFTEMPYRLPGFFVAITRYIRLLLLPFGLHHDYGKRFFRFLEPAALLGLVMFFSLLIYAFKKRESNRLVFFSIMWFFVALLPFSSILPLHAYMAERWLYIPSIAFFLILAKCLTSLYRARHFKTLAVAVTAGLLLYYSGITIKQNNYWNDPTVFYGRTLKYAPYSLKARNNLANVYIAQRRFNEAVELYKEAIKIDPNYEDAYVNLGNAYGVMERYDEAIDMYRKAIEIKPDDEKAWYNMANVYAFLGEQDESIKSYEKAIELNPRYWKAYNKLGMIYGGMGKMEESIVLLKKAIEINPYDSWSYNSLGIAYGNVGKREEAIASFKKAIKIDPDLAAAQYNLAIMYYYAEKYDLAIEHCDRAVELRYRVNPAFLKSLEPYRKSKETPQ